LLKSNLSPEALQNLFALDARLCAHLLKIIALPKITSLDVMPLLVYIALKIIV